MRSLFQTFSSLVDSILPWTPKRANARRGNGLYKGLAVLCALCAVSLIVAGGQTFTTLVSFNKTNGDAPEFVSLAQGRDGNLWGTTLQGGTGTCGSINCGTAFKITPAGKLTPMFNFNSASGYNPVAGLLLGTDGNFYGVTSLGGAHSNGTVFKLTPTGALTVLFDFDGTHGAVPAGALTRGTGGDFYGTTTLGGSGGVGTIFRMTPAGALTTLYNFDSTHGAYPYGQLVQGTDGNFYGTTELGGPANKGTVFKMNLRGGLAVLHCFTGFDGFEVVAGLIQGQDGNFYGTTVLGGPSSIGTVFKITSAGSFTHFLSFGGTNTGGEPYAPLIQATDGNFYGTTYYGTIFQLTEAGVLTTLQDFSGTNGQNPEGGLVQHTNGAFYGVTNKGGTRNFGVVYSLNTGLGPFVKTLPTSGRLGAKIGILGTSLTGATVVTFNGTPATFSLGSDSFINVTVPAGATSGPVQVTTPAGTLISNVNFTITP